MLTYGNHFVGKRNNYLLKSYDKYNPLHLPPNTVRVRTEKGNPPAKFSETTYETATLVEGTTDVYDVYKSGNSFNHLLYNGSNIIEVLGANTTGITDMQYMFYFCDYIKSVPIFDTSSVTNMFEMFCRCESLESVPLFDTSNVTDMDSMCGVCLKLTSVRLFNTVKVITMQNMFDNCRKLTSVPLFDTSNVTIMDMMFNYCEQLTNIPLFNTSKVTDMDYMLYGCSKIESGALALYQQASSQANPPTNHEKTFYNCGSDTVNGAAELAQIPSDWK